MAAWGSNRAAHDLEYSVPDRCSCAQHLFAPAPLLNHTHVRDGGKLLQVDRRGVAGKGVGAWTSKVTTPLASDGFTLAAYTDSTAAALC